MKKCQARCMYSIKDSDDHTDSALQSTNNLRMDSLMGSCASFPRGSPRPHLLPHAVTANFNGGHEPSHMEVTGKSE